MKTRAKLAMLGLSLLVLAGAWALALRMESAPAQEVMAETPELIDLSMQDVTAMSWTHGEETVQLIRDADGGWANAQDAMCPIDTAAVRPLVRALAEASAEMAILEVTDFAQYGLDAPALTVMAADGDTVTTYAVGSMSLTGEYYLRLDREDTVYLETGALLPAFDVGLSDLLKSSAIPSDIAAVTGLEARTAAESYTLALGEDGQWRRVDEELGVPLEEDRVRALYAPLTELTFSRCVTWRDSEAADYGFASPQGSALLRYENAAGEEKSFMLEFGDYAGQEVYVRFAGSELIYLADAAALDALMYPAWEAMLPLTVLPFDKEGVSVLRVTFDARSYEVVRLLETTEVMVGDEATERTDVIYSSGGWVLDTERMDAWLDALSSLTADGLSPAGDGLTERLDLSIEWADPDSESATLVLRDYDSAHLLCIVDGERRLLLPRQEAEALLAELEAALVSE